MRPMLSAFAFAVLLLPAVRAADEKPRIDKDSFLPNALANATALERFSDLAISRTEDAKLKEFATDLRDKAKACREKLTREAEGLKVGFLVGLEKGRQAVYTRMGLTKGTDFDRAYLDQIISDLEISCKEMKRGGDEKSDSLKEIATKGKKECDDFLARAKKMKDEKFGKKDSDK